MKKYSILIVPTVGKPYRCEISKRRLILFSSIAAFVIFSLVLCSVLFFVQRKNVWTDRSLRERNRRLSAEVSQIKERFDSLQVAFGEMRKLVDVFMEIADLSPPDEAVRLLGYGGTELERHTTPVDSLYASVNMLLEMARFERRNLEAACSSYVKKKRIFQHTPSVMPMRGYITSRFGPRRDPFTGEIKMHEGIDIANRRGTPVRATADGRVRFAGWYHGYGKMVMINHIYYETRYGHLDKIKVKPGQYVKRGDIIGTCGRSGRTTGSHLHYEVRVGGKPVDPMNYILPKRIVLS
ncbi:M23 family metallopeptidase [bacterium]|nr:M23 family metallopeptidase [bacterium]